MRQAHKIHSAHTHTLNQRASNCLCVWANFVCATKSWPPDGAWVAQTIFKQQKTHSNRERNWLLSQTHKKQLNYSACSAWSLIVFVSPAHSHVVCHVYVSVCVWRVVHPFKWAVSALLPTEARALFFLSFSSLSCFEGRSIIKKVDRRVFFSLSLTHSSSPFELIQSSIQLYCAHSNKTQTVETKLTPLKLT